MILNDKYIRTFLLAKLKKSNAFAVQEELRLINNRAIADIVTLGKTLHGYEIKGETDTLSRLKNQVPHYNQVFDKVSIVITKKNINAVQTIVPSFWGILLAYSNEQKIKFTHIRLAKKNPECNNKDILLSLWKNELAKILGINDEKLVEKYNRTKLADMISGCYPNKKNINFEFSKQIILRKSSKQFFAYLNNI